MTRETAIDAKAVAGHLLSKTSVPPPRVTDGTVITGHYGRDDDLLAHPALLSSDDSSADLVSEG
jgi:hypothetical protein